MPQMGVKSMTFQMVEILGSPYHLIVPPSLHQTESTAGKYCLRISSQILSLGVWNKDLGANLQTVFAGG